MTLKYSKLLTAMLASLLTVNASAGFSADSFKPGDSSLPKSAPIREGGINADELATNSNALNLVLNSAIDANNVEGVKQALKAGVSLQFNFKNYCGYIQKHTNADGIKISDIKENIKTGSFSKKTLPHIMFAYPASCYQLHMLRAISAYNNIKVMNYSLEDIEALNLKKEAFESLKQNYKRKMDAITIIELIDANLPLAQKRWYASYITSIKDPILRSWLTNKFNDATMQINKNAIWDEPQHLSWDIFLHDMIKRYKDLGFYTSSLISHSSKLHIAQDVSLLPMVISLNPNIYNGIYDYTIDDEINAVLMADNLILYGYVMSMYHEKAYCATKSSLEKKSDFAERAHKKRVDKLNNNSASVISESDLLNTNKYHVSDIALSGLYERFLIDDIRLYEKPIMDKQLRHADLMTAILSNKDKFSNRVNVFDIYTSAVEKRLMQSNLSEIINNPATVGLINSDLFFTNFSHYLMVRGDSAPLARALLTIGFDSKRLYNSEHTGGATALDIVMKDSTSMRTTIGPAHILKPAYLDEKFYSTDCKYLNK